jgi:hypothetical protein
MSEKKKKFIKIERRRKLIKMIISLLVRMEDEMNTNLLKLRL